MKVYLVAGAVLASLLLNACTTTPLPSKTSRYTEDGYINYGCCEWGYFNNPNYDMGGPEKRGCYGPDCSLSLWR